MTSSDLILSVARESGAGDASAVVAYVRSVEHEAIANHSIRTYLYAADVARREPGVDPVAAEALLHACLLHDLGTIDACDGPLRFEVEGGDAAATWLREQGYDAAHQRQVWEAVALHTTPHVAERWGGLVRFTRLGVRSDFGDDYVSGDLKASVEEVYPRLDIERILSRAVVQQTVRDRRKAPGSSWAGNLLRALDAHPDDPDDPDGQVHGF